VGIVRSVFRHNGKSIGRAPSARSKRDGAGDGMGIETSAFRQHSRQTRMYVGAAREMKSPATFRRGGAEAARCPHKAKIVGASPTCATTLGRYASGQSSVAVNHVPSGFARSNRCPAHHATVAQRQSHSLPTNRRRIVTGRSLQFALLANLVIAPV
jgi:hypothetical protein